jgi:GntP family gluconate:H+ symporter
MIDPLWLLLVGMVVVLGGILFLRLHPFLALILGALIVASLTSSTSLRQFAQSQKYSAEQTQALLQKTVGERVAGEFGRTVTKIGILIAMASIIGKCLLDSGAAERIVRSVLRLSGEKRAPLAFLSSAFVLGIPVFFDTVFYLMLPLGKAMGIRTGRNYSLYIMAIVAGATMAHSLVPPTPGPLFVAGELSVNLGLMILGGIVVGSLTVMVGYVYAAWANRHWPIPLRDTADTSARELAALAQRRAADLPPLWLSILPIVLPVFLIAGNTIANLAVHVPPNGSGVGGLRRFRGGLHQLGNPDVALSIAAAIALLMLAWQNRRSRKALAPSIQSALSSGGLIILITSAGGAFGGILQQTGIGARIEALATAHRIAVLPLAFLITAVVRTAQGSATVAMITAIGITGGLAAGGQLGFHPVYLALAIGCGSKLVQWMNDSGFWLICRMSGMKESETLKTASTMMALMGTAGLFIVMLLARLFPLV